jgi:hypothetical protein
MLGILSIVKRSDLAWALGEMDADPRVTVDVASETILVVQSISHCGRMRMISMLSIPERPDGWPCQHLLH